MLAAAALVTLMIANADSAKQVAHWKLSLHSPASFSFALCSFSVLLTVLLSAMARKKAVPQRHLHEGLDINAPDSEGQTLSLLVLACAPIIEALSRGSDTLVKQLLQAGADPDALSRAGFAPLMLTSSPDTANCLLDHGADIERETDEGSTALEQACAAGRTTVVKVLLKRGAAGQMLKIDEQGHTPLSAAVNNRHEDATLLLLQQLVTQSGFDINYPQLALNQPLLCSAAAGGLTRVADFALDHGADPNITGPDGPPLLIAVQCGHHSIVELLCKKGANIHTRFGPLNSLDTAVVRGDLKAVQVLIRHGADVNVVADSNHMPAVMQAAVRGHSDVVQLLFEAGATLTAALQPDTFIVCCSDLEESKALKVAEMLLPHCSSLADNNYELGNKMLAHAVHEGKLQIAKLLHATGADVHTIEDCGTLTHYAAASGNLAVVKWLQTLGLNARAVSGEEHLLPLHCACEAKHLHIVKYMLALPGAADDIHARTSQGQTPLHSAATHGADSVVQLLLERGADVDARDVNGYTPLMDAGSVAVVQLLLAAGADATAVDDGGMTVLQCQARDGACAGTVCLLLKAGADPAATLSIDGISVASCYICWY
jgi:ankyrin repeat protein